MPGCKAPEHERREQILNAAARVAAQRRLAGLTIRDVAKEAGLSTGLVLFHFKSKDALVAALLDWLLQQNILLRPDVKRRQRPNDCLATLVRDECLRLAKNRQRTELFFEYWVAGTQTPALQEGIRKALLRYREEFRALAVETLKQHRPTARGLTAEAVAAAAVSFIHGCAIQAVMDPQHFKLTAALAVIDALTGRKPASRRLSARPRARRRSARPSA